MGGEGLKKDGIHLSHTIGQDVIILQWSKALPFKEDTNEEKPHESNCAIVGYLEGTRRRILTLASTEKTKTIKDTIECDNIAEELGFWSLKRKAKMLSAANTYIYAKYVDGDWTAVSELAEAEAEGEDVKPAMRFRTLQSLKEDSVPITGPLVGSILDEDSDGTIYAYNDVSEMKTDLGITDYTLYKYKNGKADENPTNSSNLSSGVYKIEYKKNGMDEWLYIY